MTTHLEKERVRENSSQKIVSSNWGAKLFVGTLLVILVFFWWLLIHSGGVIGHQG